MAVLIDDTGFASQASGTTIDITNLIVAADANALTCQVLMLGIAFTNLAASWDATGSPQSMTLIGSIAASGSNNGSVATFGLRNPTVGSGKTLRVSWTTADEGAAWAESWKGVNTTSDGAAFPNPNSATGNSASASVAISSATGDAVVAVHNADSAAVSSVNNTQVESLFSGAGADNGAANRASGAASVTMTATLGGAAQWVSAGHSIAAAAAGSASISPSISPSSSLSASPSSTPSPSSSISASVSPSPAQLSIVERTVFTYVD